MNDHFGSSLFRRLMYRLEIAKVPLCFLVAFSALFGFLYARPSFSGTSLQLFLAVFFLACGAASLNSFQERYRDALMRRTRNRPLVQKKISFTAALAQAMLLIIAGLVLLYSIGNMIALLVGIFAFVVYNFIYTTLKSKTLYAIIPGAICGAAPPYIGWLAAGGDVWSFRALLPVLLLFFWQIPHYLLVLLNHRSDYISSISPNILKRLSESSLQRIFLPWIAALTVTMLTFTVIPSAMSNVVRVFIVANALLMFATFYLQLLAATSPNYRYLFLHLSFSLFATMFIICCSALFFQL